MRGPRRKGVVVAELDFSGGYRIVFVDDRQRAELKGGLERIFGVHVALAVLDVGGGQEKLRDRLRRKRSSPLEHQERLPNSGGGLFIRYG